MIRALLCDLIGALCLFGTVYALTFAPLLFEVLQ